MLTVGKAIETISASSKRLKSGPLTWLYPYYSLTLLDILK